MWEEVKRDMTSKSTLFIIDVEDKLSTMKCQESSDSKTHLTCTLDFMAVADALHIPKLKHRAIADSGTSCHFSPDKSKFTNYHPLKNHHVTTADGHTFRALGMGDVKTDLPNGASYSTVILKDSVYTPDLTFTLISISRLDLVKCGALFKDEKCTISYPNGRTTATLPLSNGLY